MNKKVTLKDNTYTKDEYNNESVYYCKHCLSLRILNLNEFDYCDNCGSTDIEKGHINDWEEKYIKKYGHKYIQNGEATE